ncbi:hypothetical protein BSLG_003456 [Batrachochytrium salamandrivorans]|nr:hypothetical protein BSLG_003456 [Batrachochytrium salamandrivorans]
MMRLSVRQNLISKIEHLDCATQLEEVDFYDNRISSIANLQSLVNIKIESLTRLKDLYFVANKLSVIENLDRLTCLTNLELGANRIRSNRLTKIEGLEGLRNLEELYLSHNAIERIEGLEHNTKLTTVDVSSNRISELEGIAHLMELEELWASNNQLSKFQQVEAQLADKSKLVTVYFEGNPLKQTCEGRIVVKSGCFFHKCGR